MRNFSGFFVSAEFKIFLTLFFTYLLFAKYDGWNENTRIDLALALVNDHTLSIDNYQNNTGDKSYYQGHFYTDKAPGSSLLAVPLYFIYSKLFGKVSCNNIDLSLCEDYRLFLGLVFFLIVFTSALYTAMTAVILYYFLKYFTKKDNYRIIITYIFGLATISFQYATVFLGHASSTFFIFLAYYLTFVYFIEGKGNLFLAGILAMFSFFIDYTNIGFVILLFSYILLKHTPTIKLKVFSFFFGILLILSVLLIYNALIFDSPFDFSYRHIYSGEKIEKPKISYEIYNSYFPIINYESLENFLISLWDAVRVLFYPYRGLFFYNPALFLGLIFLILNFKKDFFAKITLLNFIILIFLYFRYITFWWGGTSFGPRYLVPIIPFFCLYLPTIFESKNKFMKITLYVTIILSFLFVLSGHQEWEQVIINSDEDIKINNIYFDNFNKYYKEYTHFLPIEYPLTKYYLPLFLQKGPRSILIERILGISFFPWVNVLFISILYILVWHFLSFNKKKRISLSTKLYK